MTRFAAVCCLAVLLAACWASPATTQAPGGPESELPALLKASPVKVDPKDDDLRKLLKERYNEALTETTLRYRQSLAGVQTIDPVFDGAQRIVKAGLELDDKPTAQVALLEKYVVLAKAHEKIAEERVRAALKGNTLAALHQAKYARADAEIQLLRAKEKAKK
jgi:hypothetical protein